MLTFCTILSASGALVTDPTWIFFVVLCIILFAPLLLRRLRIPHIIGLILAGIIVGQYGLNILDRDSSFELFGQVGIYYIMFLAGLELDMGSVEHYGRDGVKFGLLTFLFPFILGVATSHHVLGYGILTSVLLACIYSSHTLVSYPIVGRYGISRHKNVVVSVVATAFAIFAALLVLAVVVGSLNPDSTWITWVFFFMKCTAYGAFVIFFFPRLGRWFLRRFDDSVMQYIFIMALVFLSASLAKLVGLEGLLGAFLAGLVVNRLIPKTSPLMNRIEFVGNALFIPYFLIGVGMIIDVRIMLGDASTLCIIAVMVLTGTLSKLIAAGVMAWTSGESRNSMWLMFGLTNAHAAGALAIVMIGTDPSVNLMDDQVLNGTVMLILFSCIISSFATSHGAKQLALSDTTLEDNRGSYHGKCLITYSQKDNVDVMTQLAILIRNPYIPDSLMGLAVAYDGENNDGVDRYKRGKQLLEQAQSIAAAADVPMATLNRMSTNIAGGILHTMKEYECGEVIMCLEDRTTGMPKSSLGTIIDNVLGGSHREVMAVRSIVPPGTIRRVLVAIPQKAEYEVGFYKWLEHICRIGEQLDCHLEFYAHVDTLPYIRGYMQQKHDQVRSEFHEMNLWTQLLSLQQETGLNSMLVIVSARPGFISYQTQFDNLPLLIHRYFDHTSVMLLYPDQWGDPLDSVSVFTPNGTAVTRQPRTLVSWFKQTFFVSRKSKMLALAGLFCLSASAQSGRLDKMSMLVRKAALEHRAVRKAKGNVQDNRRMCALVRTDYTELLRQHDCRVLHSWGNIHAATIPLRQLNTLSQHPEINRIEAGERCVATMDTSRYITHIDEVHTPLAERPAYTGRGVVVGVMDIGFDLTHPNFYSADLSDYRIRSFWDQLDYSGQGDNIDSMFVGCEFTSRESLLRKAHSADGLIQFHGSHTSGTAAGSGYDSPYIGAAPEAEICLVNNAVGSDAELIPDSLEFLYNTASDLMGFQYIFDYADRHQQPAVISFSEGKHQDLYGDDRLAYEVLDKMVRPGRIIVASAGNESLDLTYLHKPVGKDKAQSLCMFSSSYAFYQLRSTDKTTFRLTFFNDKKQETSAISVHTDQILACEDSLLIDTLHVEDKEYVLLAAAYPSCYDASQWATELYIGRLGKRPYHEVGLTLTGEADNVECFSLGGYFNNSKSYPDFCDAITSHNVHFPSSSPSVICVGSTAYRTGIRNHEGVWEEFDCGTDGLRGRHSSIGPTMMGLTKPDVMAPGMNVVSSYNSYYMQDDPDFSGSKWDVEYFTFQGRKYSWNAQSGTSMSTPIVAGIIALWLEAIPSLSREDIMEAIANTSRHPEPSLTYPNNYYGYGEINASAGLQYLLENYDGVAGIGQHQIQDDTTYNLLGHRVVGTPKAPGIYIRSGKKVAVTQQGQL